MMIELIGRKRRSRGLALKPVPLPIAATTELEMIGRPALSRFALALAASDMQGSGPLPCPLWVISGHSPTFGRCPLYPRKGTWIGAAVMSALCQKRTCRPIAALG